MLKNRYLFSVLLFVLSLLANPAIGVAKSLEKVAVQFHWLQQFEFAGFYMAQERGFYADAGLDVTFLPHKIGETNVVADIESGKAQYGINYSSLIRDYHNQRPIIALAAIFQDSPMVLMSLYDADISTPKDLKGRKIMFSGDALSAAPIMALLFRHELTRSDFTKLEHSYDIGDLIDGHTDAVTSYIGNEPFHMQELGLGYRIFDPKESGLSFYENILFTSDTELKNHPKRVNAFVKASLEGWRYAFENIEETARIIYDKYNEQDKSIESLIYEGNELKSWGSETGFRLEISIFRSLRKWKMPIG